jgi:hypothetical protein
MGHGEWKELRSPISKALELNFAIYKARPLIKYMDNTNFCAWWENTSRVPFNSMHLVSERLAAPVPEYYTEFLPLEAKIRLGPEDSRRNRK